ncbi:concanavalin A-like lectin/glucanase domain-containing protein, partial [Pelagophyceae sp. CCMP2097]
AGRWYYEVVLLTDGLMQVGWADSDFACEPVRGQGVGDHTSSWAWDGFRMKRQVQIAKIRWNISSAPYGERWATGDVVGVLLDCDKREMRYFLNGCDLGVAFRGFRAKGLFPAASLNVGQAAHLNFGTAP